MKEIYLWFVLIFLSRIYQQKSMQFLDLDEEGFGRCVVKGHRILCVFLHMRWRKDYGSFVSARDSLLAGCDVVVRNDIKKEHSLFLGGNSSLLPCAVRLVISAMWVGIPCSWNSCSMELMTTNHTDLRTSTVFDCFTMNVSLSFVFVLDWQFRYCSVNGQDP